MERYSRNIILENIGIDGQNRLLQSKVLVAGCGGLGSAVLSCLTSMGIGTIGLIDFDRVEISNLNRQFIHTPANIGKPKTESAKEWINNYNPEINVLEYPLKLDEDNFKDIIPAYDIVIDCFDSYESKFLLNKACICSDKILIHGGVSEFYGQVMVVNPKKTACLECLFPDNKNIQPPLKGIISPVVNLIGSIQAMETSKIILNTGEPLFNIFLSYDSLKQEFKKIHLKPNPDCKRCK